jgi:hypothetical protein
MIIILIILFLYGWSDLPYHAVSLLLFLKMTLTLEAQNIYFTAEIIFFLLSGSIACWCFFIKHACPSLFLYYGMSIVTFYTIKKILFYCVNQKNLEKYKPIIMTIIFAFFYHSGLYFNHKTILPIFYPLTPLSSGESYLLPFFNPHNQWIYCACYLIIINIVNIKAIVLYSIIVSTFFSSPITETYWMQTDIQSLTLEKIYYKKRYIFPEGIITIKNHTTLNTYKSLSKKTNSIVIVGAHWEEQNEPYEQNGVIIIYPNETIQYQKKYPTLPFAETIAPHEEKNIPQKTHPEILICSEFFLLSLDAQIKLPRPLYLVASVEWTKSPYTFWGPGIMMHIYKLYTYGIKRLDDLSKSITL